MECTAAFDELQQLSSLLGASDANLSSVQGVQLNDAVYSIQKRFMSLYRTIKDYKGREDRSWYLAALLYVECFLRDVSPDSAVALRFTHQLKSIVVETTWPWVPQSDDARQSQLWFWTLFVGGVVTLESEESYWFADQAHPFCESLHLKSWKEAETTLRLVCWPGERLSNVGSSFFQKMQASMYASIYLGGRHRTRQLDD